MSQQSGHDCRGVWRKHCWLAGQAGGIQDSHESDAAPWNAAESAMATLSADEDEFDIAEDRGGGKLGKGRVGQSPSAGPPGSGSLRPALQGGARRRRTRCRRCEACVRSECGECTFCKDMKKFGGPGKMKQSCIQRQCYAPILPHTAVCRVCGEAGKEDTAEGDEERFNISLMECSICNEIVHPACIKVDDTEGVINDELPNCWECPKCNQEGKTGKKRGPGFKYASSLPGSMLREAVGSLGGSAGERRRSDDLSRRRMDDEESSEGFQEDGNDDRLLGSGESAVDTDDGAEADADGPEHLSDVSGTPSPPLLPPAQPNHTMAICRKGQEDGLVNKRRRDGEAAAPLGQRKKQIKLEKAEKLMRRKKRKAMDVNGRTESDDRGEMPEGQDKSLGTDLNQSWGRDILGMGGSGRTTGRNAAGPSFRDEAIRERRPNAKWPRDPERTKPCTAQAKDNARPALWGLQHSEPHPGGRGWGPCDWDGSANGSRREDEEDAGLGENGSRTPRLFSSNELLQKAAKTLNGTTRGTSRPPDQLSCSRQTAMPLRLCGNTRLGGLPRPPTSVSPPKPHLLERHVIKPPLVSPPPDSLPLADGGSHPLRHEVWVSIFRHLSHRDLCLCMRVCKTWNRWCCDRRLWTRLDLSKCKAITPLMLSGIIRRQPLALDLSWSNVSKKQLAWLVNRLPGLQELIVCGCPWVAVSGLCSASLPPLHALDLRWAEGVRDAHLRDLLAADSDYSTGSDGRLRSVRELRLAGLEISDAALPLLVLHAPSLHTLDLSHCGLLTDHGLDLLSAPGTSTQQSLRQLILTGCVRITDACLPLLARCAVLERLDLRSCRLVSPDACLRFVSETVPHGIFSLPEERLIERAHCGRNATVACTTVGS